MKVTLITLSGNAEAAHTQLRERWPDAEIIDLPRSILEDGGMPKRLHRLRGEGPDIFAVMTESLGWQFGQDALMYFGALAGAKKSMVLDARGESRIEIGGRLLTSSPFRIANSYLRGRWGVRKAKQRLSILEKAATPAIQTKAGPIKIAYLRTTPSAGTVPGGATSHINGVVNGLSELGAEIEFIANDRIAGIDESSPSFHRLGPDQNVMPRAAFDISNGLSFSDRSSELVKRIEPSFIYERYSRFSLAGVEASVTNGIPLFLEYNGSEVWVGKHWDSTARLDLLERYENLNLDKAARIFVVSDVERDTLVGRGVPVDKIVVNPNGVDPDKFKPGVGGHEIRRELGLGDKEKLAGFLGTFGPWHGVLALADAIALTPKSTGLQFLFVGDGSLRAEVEGRLRASNDLDRVIFTGSVSHEKVAAYLDACDILVSPHIPLAEGAEFFGSPTKLFEYMAMGKGIVASRLGQIGDVLDDGATALLVEPGNINELSTAIQKLAADKALLAELGNASRAIAIELHTWKKNAERVLKPYRQLNTTIN